MGKCKTKRRRREHVPTTLEVPSRQRATALANKLTDELAQRYNCYDWEIAYERKREKNRRKELRPFIDKHLNKGIVPSQEELFRLLKKHKVIKGDEEGEMDLDLDTMPADFLEEFLELQIRLLPKKSAGQHM
tara:strand:+ start:7721 stop:8116 length:396 start_codon:yes stop_codon:yes gene_type:complete